MEKMINGKGEVRARNLGGGRKMKGVGGEEEWEEEREEEGWEVGGGSSGRRTKERSLE